MTCSLGIADSGEAPTLMDTPDARRTVAEAILRFADSLADGTAGLDGSVATAELIDECYRRAGLAPRGLTGG